jgi:peptidoglycan-associated lipoprotein
LEDIPFPFDSIEIVGAAMASAERNAAWFSANPGARVEIEGHCDERGTSEYNLALGAKRARAVRDMLVSLGVDADALTTVSYGEELPLCKESTDSCWESNRRAHLVELGR